jgi:DNA repair and recombination protein RAD52
MILTYLQSKLDVDDLHRHPDFAPVKKEPMRVKPSLEDDDLPPHPSIAGRNTSTNSAADMDAEFGSKLMQCAAHFTIGR